MQLVVSNLLNRASNLINVQPILALMLAGAFIAVFLTALMSARPAEPGTRDSLLWTVYQQLARICWALVLTTFLVATLSLLRVYLHQGLAKFQRTHGRVTEANYNAIQT